MLQVALLDHAGLAALDVIDLLLEHRDALADQTPVDFKLLFAGAARSDPGRGAAGDALQMAPHPREARIGVLHLRQLDLQFCLMRPCPRGEDVENQF